MPIIHGAPSAFARPDVELRVLHAQLQAVLRSQRDVPAPRRRGRATAIHAIWAGPGGRAAKQQAARAALRSDGRYDVTLLNALFAQHDLRNPAPAAPPPPGAPMPAPPPNLAHAAAAAQLAADDDSDDDEPNDAPPGKRTKFQPSELNRILFGVRATAFVLDPKWMVESAH